MPTTPALAPASVQASASSSKLSYHQHYKIFRDYIEHEDGLIDKRLLWNINIQGFLFATYGFSVQKLAEVQGHRLAELSGAKALYWLIFLLPLLGIGISVYSLKGVDAAQNAIRKLKDDWEAAEKQHTEGEPRILYELPKLPGIIGGGDAGTASCQANTQGIAGRPPFLKKWLESLRPRKYPHDAHTEGFRAPQMFPKIFITAWVALFASYCIPWSYYFLKLEIRW